MLRVWPVLLLTLALGWPLPAAAGDDPALVLVAHPESGIEHLSHSEVVNLYMGRLNRLPSGVSALPLDLVGARATFYRLLVDKRLAEINAYWARLVFSGRASPPRQVESVEELLTIVASNPGAIGYAPRSAVDGRVVIIAEVDGASGRFGAGAQPAR